MATENPLSRDAAGPRDEGITAGVVIVGNEILSGKVADTNSVFLARELRAIGAELCRVVVVADAIEEIAEVVRDFARRFHVVFTSGGVGPTHDDVTIAGVARALGRPVMRHPEIEMALRQLFKDKLNAAGLKMAEVPEGAELIRGGDLSFPVVKVENVYLLPGIPSILEEKFHAIKARFAGPRYHLKALYSARGESAIAEYLDATLAKFPELLLGSYPRLGDPEYRVKVTLESKTRAYVEAAFAHLVDILPEGTVVRTEG
jgi:molybdenum cofactor synthesis domain-containing protein